MGKDKYVFGIDVGATGTKGAVVDLATGKLVTERIKLPTPESKKPDDIADTVRELIKLCGWKKGLIGCGFPSVVKDGVCFTAANIHRSWIGVNIEKLFKKATGIPFKVVNDADAAGMAELEYGNVKDNHGTVILLTLGTGIGSAMFIDGKLIPNTELGHILYRGSIAEEHLSNNARKERGISYEQYGTELNNYFQYLKRLFYPNMIVLGGGISKKIELFNEPFTIDLPVINAKMYNDAGIIGASLVANGRSKKKK